MRSNIHGYIPRNLEPIIIKKLKYNPVIAILGPRQCGKTSLAKRILRDFANSIYLDLERISDRNKLREPELFLNENRNRLICLDEIQMIPEIFSSLRSHIDDQERNGQFLILGSASRDMIKQSSESLAGRVSYLELSPFSIKEWNGAENEIWIRGGYPRSVLSDDEIESYDWRLNFIDSYLQRDIPALGFNIPLRILEKLWKLIAHSQGGVLNQSKIATVLGVSNHTIKKYLSILSETFLVRLLSPFSSNVKKRLIKSPKVYIRDSGLFHALLGLRSMNDLLGYPEMGASWEGFVIEQILSSLPDWDSAFYLDTSGSEIDLVIQKGRKIIAVECKASSSPKVHRGFWSALETVGADEAWILAPVKGAYPYNERVRVASPKAFLETVG